MRPCVRPVGAARMTAGHNAFREDGSRSITRARSAWARLGFPVFRYRPAFALHHVRPSQLLPFTALSPARVLWRERLAIALAAGHDRPHHAGVFVGDCNRRHLWCLAGQKLNQPWSAGSVPHRKPHHRQPADDQEAPQTTVTLFCSDAIGNVAVMLAAVRVFDTGTLWPDVVVAAIMATLLISGGWAIVLQARTETRNTRLRPIVAAE